MVAKPSKTTVILLIVKREFYIYLFNTLLSICMITANFQRACGNLAKKAMYTCNSRVYQVGPIARTMCESKELKFSACLTFHCSPIQIFLLGTRTTTPGNGIISSSYTRLNYRKVTTAGLQYRKLKYPKLAKK